jgi:hypothetical protein
MVVDACERVTDHTELAATALKRSDVIGTVLAQQVFALMDAIYIYMGDQRLAELPVKLHSARTIDSSIGKDLGPDTFSWPTGRSSRLLIVAPRQWEGIWPQFFKHCPSKGMTP